MIKSQVEKALKAIHSSPFYITPNYKVDFDARRLHDNLYTYNTFTEKTGLSLKDTISYMTPTFQRKNNKWNKKQKTRFVENLLSGCRSEITLFTTKHDNMDDCEILDGLQRLTAVSEFILGEFPIFDDVYFHQIATPNIFINGRVSIRVYEFPTLRKAVEFYIAMNEGITHSPEDIQHAKNFLATLPEDK